LHHYDILDTPDEAAFADITGIAAHICGASMAAISLVDRDRQWFKSRLGIDVPETPRDWAFCDHAIRQRDVFEVTDATLDARFADNPLVTGSLGLRFYAGAPLETPDGLPLGTLCVLDSTPHHLNDQQREALRALARQVMAQLELRRALAARRRDEARNRQILASATDYAIISMDLAGRVTSWNEGACRILGWSEAEMCGQPCDVFFTPEDQGRGQPRREMSEALSLGRAADERWHLRKSGERFWGNGETMPLRDDVGAPVGFIKILRDRTPERLSRERLEATERRVKLAMEAAELGAWETSPDLSMIECDARSHQLFELADDRPVRNAGSFLASVHPGDRARVEAAVEVVLASGGERLNIQYRVVGREDRIRHVNVHARLIEGGDGPARLVGIVQDVTARAAAEEHRELLANELQHRIKNMLAVVQGIVSQSLRTIATPAAAREAIGDRLAALARAHDLLTQTNWSAAPIGSIVDGSVAVAGAHKGRVRSSGPGLHLRPRSALALAMALHELTTNAIKYGALSNDSGFVDFTWRIGGERGAETVEMCWQEVGGPPVDPPEHSGFGSRLIGDSLRVDLGGAGVSEYRRDGLVWLLCSRRTAIEQK
ncbi:MAG: domain S-box protein, partial [Sphingomonas bacterium]